MPGRDRHAPDTAVRHRTGRPAGRAARGSGSGRWSSRCSAWAWRRATAPPTGRRARCRRLADLRGAGRRGADRAARRHGRAARAPRASWTGPGRSSPRMVAAPPAPPRVDPWRRTSGIHRIRDRASLAIVRELWTGPRRSSPPPRPRAAPGAAGRRHRRRRDRPAQDRGTPWCDCRSSPAGSSAGRLRSGGWPPSPGRRRCRPASCRRPRCPPTAPAAGEVVDEESAGAARLAAARSALAARGPGIRAGGEHDRPPTWSGAMWTAAGSRPSWRSAAAGGARPWQVELTAGDSLAAPRRRPRAAVPKAAAAG